MQIVAGLFIVEINLRTVAGPSTRSDLGPATVAPYTVPAPPE